MQFSNKIIILPLFLVFLEGIRGETDKITEIVEQWKPGFLQLLDRLEHDPIWSAERAKLTEEEILAKIAEPLERKMEELERDLDSEPDRNGRDVVEKFKNRARIPSFIKHSSELWNGHILQLKLAILRSLIRRIRMDLHSMNIELGFAKLEMTLDSSTPSNQTERREKFDKIFEMVGQINVQLANDDVICTKWDIDRAHSKLTAKYFGGEMISEEEHQSNREKFGTIVRHIFGLKKLMVEDVICTGEYIEKALVELEKIGKLENFDENANKRIRQIVMNMIMGTEFDMLEKRVKAKIDKFSMLEGFDVVGFLNLSWEYCHDFRALENKKRRVDESYVWWDYISDMKKRLLAIVDPVRKELGIKLDELEDGLMHRLWSLKDYLKDGLVYMKKEMKNTEDEEEKKAVESRMLTRLLRRTVFFEQLVLDAQISLFGIVVKPLIQEATENVSTDILEGFTKKLQQKIEDLDHWLLKLFYAFKCPRKSSDDDDQYPL